MIFFVARKEFVTIFVGVNRGPEQKTQTSREAMSVLEEVVPTGIEPIS